MMMVGHIMAYQKNFDVSHLLPKPLVLGAAHSAPARRIQAFLVSGLERTGPGNQGGVTVTYTGTPGHNDGL